MHEVGLNRYVVSNKPLISERNRKLRLKFAKKHLSWSFEQWSRVLFSDESPFTLRWRGKQMVWRRRGERFKSKFIRGTIKHDKKIMVWGCFSSNGIGHLKHINGIMDGNVYKQILIHHMRPSAKILFPD